ncbi:MAG: hypothetical protein LBG95_01940 [Treponema sp.]|jgi:alpha-mannosidase|nr:hypothetical protein [Treponema sp.]
MGTLAGRLYAIKLKVGGNREKRGWEQATDTSLEVQHRMIGMNPEIRRILAELGFALCLSGAEKDKPLYAAEISSALGILEKSLESQGVLTADACRAAEEAVLPLKKAAKEYTVLCAAHAHLDMNWMWGWNETVQSTLATFRTMLALMDEYPEFTFSQSQASCYKLVEDYDPELMEAIKKRIAEGRWEVTASAWVETDKNMPCTESLIRHISITRKYLESVWGVNPSSLNIDFSPDTFGHSAHIPEIDAYGGVKYMYHCRGLAERHILYRWRSPSGAEILNHCEPNWYNRGIQDEIALGAVKIASLCGGLKTSLIVYGVGDHGGGPTRRDIDRITEMREWPVYPAMRFGSFAEYFREAETVRDKVPVFDREINYIYSGCYTSQSRIKLANRRTEAALLDAEFLDSMSFPFTGKRYPPNKLEEAWRKTLFSHFHDILTGSNVRDSREYAMANYSDAQAAAGTAREKAGTALAALIDTSMFGESRPVDDRGNRSQGAGPAFGLGNFGGIPVTERGCGSTRIYHVFNPCAFKRRDMAEFILWDWDYDFTRVELCDHLGNAVPFQILDKEPVTYWEHRYVRFLAFVEIPAGGYATLALREKEHGVEQAVYFNHLWRTEEFHGPVVLENEFLRAEFDTGSGALLSLKDKKANKEKIAAGKSAGLVINWAEKSTNSAWSTGRYMDQEAVRGSTRLTPNLGNSLRNGFEMEQECLGSRIKTTVNLDAGAKALSYQFKIDWKEAAADHQNVPVLCFALPLEDTPESFQTDVPAGIQKHPGAFHDIPGLQYAAAINGAEAAAIITDCKYGYRGVENNLYATLINTSAGPDPYPERGEHVIKLWLAVEDSDPKVLYDAAFALCHPVSIISGTRHKGKLPPARELLSLNAASTALSSSGLCPDGALLLRFCEMAGRKDAVTVSLPLEIADAQFVDLDGAASAPVSGAPVSGAPVSIQGNSMSFETPPHKICGVRLTLKNTSPP